MNKRLDYIDSLKGFAIMLMVLCHSGLHNSATQWIYSFHMPLFFIVSGFLFSEPNSRNFLQYLRKKVKQLLVPFLIFSLVLCFGRRNYVDWCYILYGSRNALAEATTFTPLWFLPCFFLSTLIFRSAFYIPNDILRYVIICIIGITGFVLSRIMPSGAIGLPWNLNVALVGVFLMLIGFAIKKIKIGPILGGGNTSTWFDYGIYKFTELSDRRKSSCRNVNRGIWESHSFYSYSCNDHNRIAGFMEQG